MRIEQRHEMSLDAGTAMRIGALLDLVFAGGFERRGHFLLRHHMRFFVPDGTGVVGHLGLGLRVMRLGSELIDTVTLAEVATHPDRRGEGIASALLAEAVARARDTGASVAMLFGDAGIYHAAGFRAIANPVRWVDMTGRVTRGVVDAPIADLMMLPLDATGWNDALPLDLLGPKF